MLQPNFRCQRLLTVELSNECHFRLDSDQNHEQIVRELRAIHMRYVSNYRNKYCDSRTDFMSPEITVFESTKQTLQTARSYARISERIALTFA